MPNQKRTKIVATLGPATSEKETIKKMILAGVDVFRINFSHANYDDVKQRIKMIRDLGDELHRSTAILADLQGPKLRVGIMKEEIVVEPGDKITFCTGDEFEGSKDRIYMNYRNFPKDVNPGERILLDDGKLIFEIEATNNKNEVNAVVVQGGPLRSKKRSEPSQYENLSSCPYCKRQRRCDLRSKTGGRLDRTFIYSPCRRH